MYNNMITPLIYTETRNIKTCIKILSIIRALPTY